MKQFVLFINYCVGPARRKGTYLDEKYPFIRTLLGDICFSHREKKVIEATWFDRNSADWSWSKAKQAYQEWKVNLSATPWLSLKNVFVLGDAGDSIIGPRGDHGPPGLPGRYELILQWTNTTTIYARFLFVHQYWISRKEWPRRQQRGAGVPWTTRRKGKHTGSSVKYRIQSTSACDETPTRSWFLFTN